ncbi:lactadherin isoform X2 [Castor canadensis]|uniref:Lactadherin n=1 Tax=Castor canadensis TaxID=51338 RepID=A0A250Y0Q8_CASCN|nr:lactadherin isoform X2 [Castor canadensis]
MQQARVLAALCGALLCACGVLAASGDFCDSNICLNGGTCLSNQDGDFHCLCPQGFTGSVCNETEKGPCSPNPCHNNAECQVVNNGRGDSFTQYVCKCQKGFSGIHCDSRCIRMLGLMGGAIEDSQISASSLHVGFLGLQRWTPELARLHLTGIVNAWSPSSYDRKSWIQVNLRRKMLVSGLMTQGASHAGFAVYVKTFRVAYSSDGHKFQFIQDMEGSGDKVFEGNWDSKSVRSNMFDSPLETQYVRVYPKTCSYRGCALRLELIGCDLDGCSDFLGLRNYSIPDKSITASSFHKTWGVQAFSWHPFFARLDRQGTFNAWTAQSNNASEWLQIDLGSKKQVTGIVTQGAREFGHVQYIAAYKMAYSPDGVHWTEYKENGASESKVFRGNSDNNSHKENILETPIFTRFVRILPVAWHNRITLRMELLGC